MWRSFESGGKGCALFILTGVYHWRTWTILLQVHITIIQLDIIHTHTYCLCHKPFPSSNVISIVWPLHCLLRISCILKLLCLGEGSGSNPSFRPKSKVLTVMIVCVRVSVPETPIDLVICFSLSAQDMNSKTKTFVYVSAISGIPDIYGSIHFLYINALSSVTSVSLPLTSAVV